MAWLNEQFKLSSEQLKECITFLFKDRLSKFLLTYRLTPPTTTGVAPAEFLMGRRPRSLFDNLIPDLSQKVEYRQVKQKLHMIHPNQFVISKLETVCSQRTLQGSHLNGFLAR